MSDTFVFGLDAVSDSEDLSFLQETSRVKKLTIISFHSVSSIKLLLQAKYRHSFLGTFSGGKSTILLYLSKCKDTLIENDPSKILLQ